MLRSFALLLLGVALAAPAVAQLDDTCRPTSAQDAAAWLARAVATMGHEAGGLLHYQAGESALADMQSDRAYPPFIAGIHQYDFWYDPQTGVEHATDQYFWPGTGPTPPFTTISGPGQTFMVRGDRYRALNPVIDAFGPIRSLSAWAMLFDWQQADDVSIEAACYIRDQWRITLTRAGLYGPERLYLDAETALPVQLSREEPHYLWGQVRADFVYSNWQQLGDKLLLPTTLFRLVAGAVSVSRTLGTTVLGDTTAPPPLALPDSPGTDPLRPPMFAQHTPLDTAGVARDTYLLTNPAYTEAFTLANDTVFVFEATQSEARARADHAWIRQVHPGDRPLVVVVTDLAWPHIAGVRYWLAQGATVVSHTASEAFLRRVFEHRWTRTPDLLEQRRTTARFRFRGIDRLTQLGGGAVVVAPLVGIATEGALIAYLPAARFLWASDYIQNIRQPTQYAREVIQAAQHYGFAPTHTAAQHLPLTPWATVTALFE